MPKLSLKVVNQVNRWTATVAITFPEMDKDRNVGTQNIGIFDVTLAENTFTNCYLVEAKAIY